jgi:hypothetical protein
MCLPKIPTGDTYPKGALPGVAFFWLLFLATQEK